MSSMIEALLEGLTRWERPIVEGAVAQAAIDREHDAAASEAFSVTERAVLNAMANARDWKRSKKTVSKILRENDDAAYAHFRKVVSVCSAAAGMVASTLENGAGAKDIDAALASEDLRETVVESIRRIRDGETEPAYKLNARAVQIRREARKAEDPPASQGDAPEADGPTFSTEQAAFLSDLRKTLAGDPFRVTPEEWAENLQPGFLAILRGRAG